MPMVVAIRLAVGGHVHQLCLRTIAESALQAIGKILPRIQQSFKRNRP